jgi:hypothetical protein
VPGTQFPGLRPGRSISTKRHIKAHLKAKASDIVRRRRVTHVAVGSNHKEVILLSNAVQSPDRAGGVTKNEHVRLYVHQVTSVVLLATYI